MPSKRATPTGSQKQAAKTAKQTEKGGEAGESGSESRARIFVLHFEAQLRFFATYLGDLKILSDAEFSIEPGERVCLFMDRLPELYLGVLAVLKMGCIAQPLFSAFGDESLWTRLDNAGTAVVITQRKHVKKVRKILDRLPELKHVVVVDSVAALVPRAELEGEGPREGDDACLGGPVGRQGH